MCLPGPQFPYLYKESVGPVHSYGWRQLACPSHSPGCSFAQADSQNPIPALLWEALQPGKAADPNHFALLSLSQAHTPGLTFPRAKLRGAVAPGAGPRPKDSLYGIRVWLRGSSSTPITQGCFLGGVTPTPWPCHTSGLLQASRASGTFSSPRLASWAWVRRSVPGKAEQGQGGKWTVGPCPTALESCNPSSMLFENSLRPGAVAYACTFSSVQSKFKASLVCIVKACLQ